MYISKHSGYHKQVILNTTYTYSFDHAAVQRRVSGNAHVELVYNLPESIRKAGLSTIAIELPQDSAVALWEATGHEGEESRKDSRRMLFVKKLNDHIHKHFHLKLEVSN